MKPHTEVRGTEWKVTLKVKLYITEGWVTEQSAKQPIMFVVLLRNRHFTVLCYWSTACCPTLIEPRLNSNNHISERGENTTKQSLELKDGFQQRATEYWIAKANFKGSTSKHRAKTSQWCEAAQVTRRGKRQSCDLCLVLLFLFHYSKTLVHA